MSNEWRRPCEHGRYEFHLAWDVPDNPTMKRDCPGGDFLADDALVIERERDGKFPEWIIDVDGPVWFQCGGTDDLLEDIFEAVRVRANQANIR